MRTHYCGQLNAGHVDQIVTLCGWNHRRRDHGGVIFIDLRDREGLAQIVCDPDRPEMFKLAESVRNEFVLKITGHELEILNAAVTPPFQLDDDNLSENVRLVNRVIDLRRPQMQKNMMLRYKTARAFRQEHPRRRPRLPRAVTRAPRPLLRVAAIAATLQAIADGCRFRPLLPDHQVFP